MADGIATDIVSRENTPPVIGDMPLVNMWWPQTMKPNMAIATELKAMNL